MPTITQSVEDTVMPVQGRGYGSFPEGVKTPKGKKKKKKGKVTRGKSLSRAAMGPY